MVRISSADIALGDEPVDDVPARLTGLGRFRGSLLNMPPDGATAFGSGLLESSGRSMGVSNPGHAEHPRSTGACHRGQYRPLRLKSDPHRGVTAGTAGITLGGPVRPARALRGRSSPALLPEQQIPSPYLDRAILHGHDSLRR
jgi:hypothetical protein